MDKFSKYNERFQLHLERPENKRLQPFTREIDLEKRKNLSKFHLVEMMHSTTAALMYNIKVIETK